MNRARFSLGDKVNHTLYDYRGIILDVDPQYQNDDEWYEAVATSRPAKDQPWYMVLVHGTEQMTYVAEQNLELDSSDEEIEHPVLPLCFKKNEKGQYQRRQIIQ
jgi:heat shock protein HspQ